MYICNPINFEYKYQFFCPKPDICIVNREAADPSMILFKDKYYCFSSMSLGFWTSNDLVSWEYYRLPDELPLYDYAPDVRVIGEYVYFSASKKGENCSFYRTKDLVNGPFEEMKGSFPFWDPNLFYDDDGKVYFYWGCSSNEPLYGIELNPDTMKPIGKKVGLIFANEIQNGYERPGNDHILPFSQEEIEMRYRGLLMLRQINEKTLSEEIKYQMKRAVGNTSYIEGAWMTKYLGKYYLQYAFSGTEYNVYGDGVYISDSPLGPFELAKNNPYSYKPGGFINGAGHGSTIEDKDGNWWHTSTMGVCVNYMYERRIGIWPAGFDKDGELFCNQQYGDWPMKVTKSTENPWSEPEWYLLSYKKPMVASSNEEGHGAEFAADENVKTWWRAADKESGQTLTMDLMDVYDIRAIQVNFADDRIELPRPKEEDLHGEVTQLRNIYEGEVYTRWILEASCDGVEYFVIEDKSNVETNLPHDLIIYENGIRARYLELTIYQMPFNQNAAVSGLRVFGKGNGKLPNKTDFTMDRITDNNVKIKMHADDAIGYQILWGHKEDKLYHSCMVFGSEKSIGALVAGVPYFIRVDSFNESGITHGDIKKL